MLEVKTLIKRVCKSGAAVVYIPSKLVSDSLFPFALPHDVNVRIDGSKLIIEAVVDV